MKQLDTVSSAIIRAIREQDPLKQGLKQARKRKRTKQKNIREQDPLKQGLKLISGYGLQSLKRIREQDPLKQGLKLFTSRHYALANTYS